jgi:sodium transport system permease protein
MSKLMTVLIKECRDNLRDRRTIISSFSLAIGGPALFIAMMSFVLNTAVGKSDDPVLLGIAGAENAPGLVAYLESQNTEITLIDSEDPKAEIIADRHDLILSIRPDYAERFRAGQINSVALIYDSSELGGVRRQFAQAREMISRYARNLGMLRLQLRGVEPAITAPVIVQEVDTASPAARALSILATLPYLMVLVVFMGGFYLAIDSTAGEREHGSLEPLLSQPISRRELVLGKMLATSVFSAMSVILFLASLAIAMPFVPLHRIGMSLEISLPTMAAIFLISIPLMLFGAALLTVVASFAKSYKEAQTYLTLVILVPTVPLIITQLMSVKSSTALMSVPSLSQALLINELISGATINPLHVGVSVICTTLAAALIARLAIYLYSRERILI